MLIETQTTADTANIKINAEQTLSVRGDLVAETITLSVPDGAGGWNLLYEGGEQVVLDATHLQVTAYGNALIQVYKPITTNAVGITVVG